ncbi:uncharacterized protein J3R85_001717 [Psidium guajava]|nr:uncharacterized protein J3R85_001717 [Psidium guajava]
MYISINHTRKVLERSGLMQVYQLSARNSSTAITWIRNCILQ